MNPTGKKLISLFLIFSLMMLSVNLYAKKRGAKIEIWVTGDRYIRHIKGELITVSPNSLLLLNREGKDVSVDIADIKSIRVVKKSKLLLGAGIGLGIGGVGVLLLGGGVPSEDTATQFALSLMALGIGLLIGTIGGVVAGTDKTFQIEGMSDSEIQETLKKLRKKARIRKHK